MSILKLIIVGLIFFICLADRPANQLKGEIVIKSSEGELIPLNNVPILLIKRSKAEQIRNSSINKLFLLEHQLDLEQTVALSKSDGKFSLDIPDGEYTVAVLTNKIINGDNSVFFWLVDVNKDQPASNILLNNFNLTEDFVAEEQF